MKGYPSPECRQCHGSGDFETMVETAIGLCISYNACPCTFHAVWVDEEDWTNERARQTGTSTDL